MNINIDIQNDLLVQRVSGIGFGTGIDFASETSNFNSRAGSDSGVNFNYKVDCDIRVDFDSQANFDSGTD